MKVHPDCSPCFFSQAVKTAQILGVDDRTIWQILKRFSLRFSEMSENLSPPVIGREVYRIVSEVTGISDPYFELKKICTNQAMKLYPGLKAKVEAAEDPLFTAVKISAAGNVIDFGTEKEFDLEDDVSDLLSEEFAIDHFLQFQGTLKSATTVLFVADNAGETVFDRILIEALGKSVIYAVKEVPILNDATEEDARSAGIHRVAEVISSGSVIPGTDLQACTGRFKKAFASADLIISKGQGNYECLSEEVRPIFFILKAKCSVVARDLEVEEGRLVLKGNFVTT